MPLFGHLLAPPTPMRTEVYPNPSLIVRVRANSEELPLKSGWQDAETDPSIQPVLNVGLCVLNGPVLWIAHLTHLSQSWQLFGKCQMTLAEFSHAHARMHATVKITHFSSCHSASAHSLLYLASQLMKRAQIQWMRMSVHTWKHAQPAPWPEPRLRTRRHMWALTGDTEQTRLLSIKPVNSIIRLADFSGKILLTVSLSACFYNLHGNIYMCSLSHFIPFSSVLAWLHHYYFCIFILLLFFFFTVGNLERLFLQLIENWLITACFIEGLKGLWRTLSS